MKCWSEKRVTKLRFRMSAKTQSPAAAIIEAFVTFKICKKNEVNFLHLWFMDMMLRVWKLFADI